MSNPAAELKLPTRGCAIEAPDGVVHRCMWVGNEWFLYRCDFPANGWRRPLEKVYVVNTGVTCVLCLAKEGTG